MGREGKCEEWKKKKYESGNWEVEGEIERGKLRGYGRGKRQKQAPEEAKSGKKYVYEEEK